MDIILRTSFWDVLMTFAGRFSKTLRIKCESLVFHATHLVSTIEHNTALMCFLLCLKLTSWRRPKDVTMHALL